MLINNSEYLGIIDEIKIQIQTARHKAILGANKELICLYWNIGKIINENSAWGNKFIENLARDIKLEFPSATGYSARNLKYMAKFQTEYKDFEIVPTTLAQLPWSHNRMLLDKLKDIDIRIWYAKRCAENGWTLNVLAHHISLNLYERQVISGKVQNFSDKLPTPQIDLALQTMKYPYIFDFIADDDNANERDIENQLVKNIANLLMELGTGFAFLGTQYHLEVGGEDFYIDLLFYNLTLRCYVVIELKSGKFKPEYAGKLNFYLSAVDGILKTDKDNPSIGILLCREKNNIIAEFALKDMTKPMGISEYKLTGALPENLENTLPSAEDIISRLANTLTEHLSESEKEQFKMLKE